MVEMYVESIRVSMVGMQRVVVLKERTSERYLLIWIGNPEAGAIALALQGVPPPRPLTHDLLKAVIESLGARVVSIIVNDLVDNTFYARIMLEIDGHEVDVDARPSDAIALALRTQAPIYVSEKVLDEAGIVADSEPQNKEEEDKLKIFRDFINSLGQDDASTTEGDEPSADAPRG
jgi:bifunctional DNase/RNase